MILFEPAQRERIAPTGAQRPRMYGLPKIHKPNAPLRLIFSKCGSAHYDISIWLCEILKPVLDCYNVRSNKYSFTFVDKIWKTGVTRDGYMCSFDEVNLFTNVPLASYRHLC